MAIRQETTMTEDEYARWSLTIEERTEFVDGKVIFHMTESIRDEDARWFLGRLLLAYIEERNLGKLHGPNLMIRPRPGLRRVPDLLFIAHKHLSQLSDTCFAGGPDLAVEIISRDSKRRDRVDKFAEYQEAGVREYWILDHRIQRLDPFTLGADGRYHPMPLDDGILRSQVVDGFWMRVDWLWQQPRPTINALQRELGLI